MPNDAPQPDRDPNKRQPRSAHRTRQEPGTSRAKPAAGQQSRSANQPAGNQPAGKKTSAKKPANQKRKSPRIAAAQIETDEEQISWWQSFRQEFRQSAPAALGSLFFHLVLLVLLALISISMTQPETLDLTFGFGLEEWTEEEETQEPSVEVSPIESDPMPQPESSEIEDPEPTVPEVVEALEPEVKVDPWDKVQLTNTLTGREQGTKEQLLAEFGGTPGTELAVEEGLKWLARQQGRDGLWSMKGPYQDGIFLENKSAATAMALLAFLGAGHTHQSGEYRNEVARGLKALLKRQSFDGDFYRIDGTQSIIPQHRLYTHAQGMLVVCELWAMTGDESLRKPAEKAVNFAEKYQTPEGGWRYTLGSDADLSVTGWFVIGLESARMAGAKVEKSTWQGIDSFLYRVHYDDEIRFVYKRGYEPTLAMTAEGLLCRQYLGWDRDQEEMLDGVGHLLDNPIDWNQVDYYYWYYASQVLHNFEGEAWREWNSRMRAVIPEHQEQRGRDRGSWSPDGDRHAMTGGGRLYSTCMALLVLEVYYRHLPLYRNRLE